jgi:hypothetical protein
MRFKQIKLLKMPQGVAGLLPRQGRSDLLDPDRYRGNDLVPAWFIIGHMASMISTIVNVNRH